MWPFTRHTSIVRSGLLDGMTDFHSHLLPGVDDGVAEMSESLALLSEMEAAGIRSVWCTPHVMEDVPNTTEDLRARFGELKAAYKGRIELRLAAEYMLDNLFKDRLDDDDLLTIGPNNHLLVETSYFTPPMDMEPMLDKIMRKGYTPILAHPERYLYMDRSDYRKWKEKGIVFQLDLYSITGLYGPDSFDKARWLASKGMYSLIGSDTHTINQYRIAITEHTVPVGTVKRLK